jgi:transglutaminase/protease-like cytokinesis protein 3
LLIFVLLFWHTAGVNFNKRDAVFESDELLKVKRKSHNEIIVYNSTLAEQNLRTSTKRATSLKSTSLRHVNELHEGYEIEIPINPHLAGLLQVRLLFY